MYTNAYIRARTYEDGVQKKAVCRRMRTEVYRRMGTEVCWLEDKVRCLEDEVR